MGDSEFDRLLELPHFAAFARQAAAARGVRSVFLSNTYPVHASVVTGLVPGEHGLVSNTLPFPQKDPVWVSRAGAIGAKTLWQAAHEKHMDVAAVLWPVTAKSRHIRYNIPEVLARPGKSQVMANLAAGSKGLQLKMYLRHRHLLRGISQPARDAFATACMADILREKQPGLALMHLTSYDTLCHEYGRGAKELGAAFASLDENLGTLLAAAGDRYQIILFSDHSQLNVHTPVTPNTLLQKMGLLGKAGDTWLPGEHSCFFECCGGAAFFHPGTLDAIGVQRVQAGLLASEHMQRLLTGEEMRECGRASLPFGFCAKPGYCYEAFPGGEKATHGYPPSYDDYAVFYMAKGQGFAPGSTRQGGSLLDIAPMAADILGLELPQLGASHYRTGKG